MVVECTLKKKVPCHCRELISSVPISQIHNTGSVLELDIEEEGYTVCCYSRSPTDPTCYLQRYLKIYDGPLKCMDYI